MTWREKTLVHILLLVARIFADDPMIADEIKKLSTHVAVNAPKPKAVESVAA